MQGSVSHCIPFLSREELNDKFSKSLYVYRGIGWSEISFETSLQFTIDREDRTQEKGIPENHIRKAIWINAPRTWYDFVSNRQDLHGHLQDGKIW